MAKLLSVLMLGLLATAAFADDATDLAQEKKLSADYLAKMAAEPGAQTVQAGVIIRPIFDSKSTVYAKLTDTVRVGYVLSDREGKQIEESYSDDALAEFPLAKLIQCWQIAIPKMAVGSLYKLSCSSDVAYGDKGAGGGAIKGGAALTFRVTLFGIAP